MTTLITNIGELVTNDPSTGDGLLGILTGAALVVDDGRVAWVGPAAEAPGADRRVDAGGGAVLPGFVDSHAHLVFAGDRAAEFAARMAGRPYTGGGIRTTVAATRAASDDELRANVGRLRREALRQGVTTMEIKSGYGLTVVDEARCLRIAREFTGETTFLGAHVVPAEYAERPDEYVSLICGPMLREAVPYARWMDVFCERGAFDEEQSRAVLTAGKAAGLGVRVHANQLGPGPGVRLAVELGAASADHCSHLSDADVSALADSQTVATLLPAAEFSTRAAYPDARRLLDAGVTVALATDCNPGSSYTSSMPFCIALAVREMRMTPAEAVRAATAGGARALLRTDIGHLGIGARADLMILDAPSHLHLAYRPGVPLVKTIMHNGRMLVGQAETGHPQKSKTSPTSVRSARVNTVTVQPTGVSPADVLAVARGGARVELAPATVEAMETSRAIVDGIERDGRPVYGVSTGFGALAGTPIAAERRAELQHALIRSHAAGVGAPMPREVVRAMMLLRVRSLALGRSGVRPLVAQALVDLLNHDITPWVPEHGSLGASGDLAPLAHCALVLLGEGWVLDRDGTRVAASHALSTAGLRPIGLASKEGLALINGTDGMLGMLLLAISDAAHLFTMADVTAALSIEAMLGSDRPFQPELHTIRPHPGQAQSAANIHQLLQRSAIMDSHREDLAHAVQDAYSIRCAPQVAGAARDTLSFVDTVAGRELVSVVDNPVVLPDGRVESTGNFHGAPLGFAADFLAIAAAEVGSISERRVDRLLDVCRSRGLPAFLTPDPGVNSGLMIAQYTAAGIVAENRRLASPASVDSVPTSGMQEDHVSMGWAATCKLRTVLDNLASLLAVELLAGVRGLQLRSPLTPSPAGRAAVAALAPYAGEPGPDMFLAPALEAARALVCGRALRAGIEAEVGPLA